MDFVRVLGRRFTTKLESIIVNQVLQNLATLDSTKAIGRRKAWKSKPTLNEVSDMLHFAGGMLPGFSSTLVSLLKKDFLQVLAT